MFDSSCIIQTTCLRSRSNSVFIQIWNRWAVVLELLIISCCIVNACSYSSYGCFREHSISFISSVTVNRVHSSSVVFISNVHEVVLSSSGCELFAWWMIGEKIVFLLIGKHIWSHWDANSASLVVPCSQLWLIASNLRSKGFCYLAVKSARMGAWNIGCIASWVRRYIHIRVQLWCHGIGDTPCLCTHYSLIILLNDPCRLDVL